MKKILTAALLLTGLIVGNASAKKFIPHPESYDPESVGAAFYSAEINHPDSLYYTYPDFYEMTSTDDRIILTHYPTYQQMTGYSYGPSCALMVLYYYGNRDFDETTLVKRMKTNTEVGTSLGNMVKFFKSIGWDVQSGLDTPPFKDKFAFQKFVIKNLSAGKPIMVENVEFGGHWRVIIGVDTMGTDDNIRDDVLIFADPFDTNDHNQDGYTVGSLDRFYFMWFDYAMLPKKERNQPWLIAIPKK